MKTPQPLSLRVGLFIACLATTSCTFERYSDDDGVIYSLSPATWFEDGWSYYEISQDEKRALFGARFGFRLIDLERDREDPTAFAADLDRVRAATFYGEGRLARLGVREGSTGWFLEGPQGPVRSALPSDATPNWSPDGGMVAYYRAAEAGLFVGTPDEADFLDVGGFVTGVAWAPPGDVVYALVDHDDGVSSLVQVEVPGREMTTIKEGLDATNRYNSIGVSADGAFLYLALAGPGPPDPEARHQPVADRDMDIYELSLETGGLRPVVETAGDDFYPIVVGDYLYWTHNDLDDAVAVVPIAGGEARVVVEDAQIPYWNPAGSKIAFTYGAWRIADWGLNLDAGVVDVDAEMRPTSEMTPIVAGYHEDFTPAWSPDGRWIAYHSHRSAGPTPFYAGEGSTDDLYLRHPSAPPGEEIRLTDFGWEVGMADWSPDGRQLVFDSWDRGGPPGISKPWIATIDPATGRPLSVERLPLPEGVESSLLAAWSPLGGEIALVERAGRSRHALWILSVDGTQAEKLLEFPSSTYGGVDWTPDGQQLVFSALEEGRMQLFVLPRVGGEPRLLTDDSESLIHPQVSPGGRWVAATRARRAKELRRQLR
jgi:Tol biopolymer transport system component